MAWLSCAVIAAGCGQRQPGPSVTDDGGFVADAGRGEDAGGRSDAGHDAGTTGTALVGEPCLKDADCAPISGEAFCESATAADLIGYSAPGGYCTSRDCSPAAPATTCGLATVCNPGSGPLRCESACATTAGCRQGYFCIDGGCGISIGPTPDGGYPNAWGPPQPMTALNTGAYEGGLTFTPDLLRVCYGSNEGGGSFHIHCASRTSDEVAFENPAIQAAITSSTDDTYPYIWHDRLYFMSRRSGNADLYVARWNASNEAYENPQPLPNVNTSAGETSPSLSPDGLTLYFASDRAGGAGGVDIWKATRATTDTHFGTPTLIPELNSASDDLAPVVAADGSFIAFASTRASSRTNSVGWIARAAAGGGWEAPQPMETILLPGHLLRDPRPLPNGWLAAECDQSLCLLPPSNGVPPPITTWGTPIALSELESAQGDIMGTTTADGLRICFASNRPGGRGSWDIWCAVRANAADPFAAPQVQSEINSTGYDANPAVSPDGTELYFGSTRSGRELLWRAVWSSEHARYESPALLSGVNGPVNAGTDGPSLSSDGLVLFFYADTGRLFMATRRRTDESFSNPFALPDISGAGNDIEPGLAPDGFTLTFHSSRPAPGASSGSSPWRLWVAGWRGDGHWSTPVPATVGGLFAPEVYGGQPLADGSLLCHTALFGAVGDQDLFIAPPAP